MSSIMVRGSLANSASKDRMSASATMLPPISMKKMINESREEIQEHNEYEASPRMFAKGANTKKPPVSQSMVPLTSKGSQRKKGKTSLLVSTKMNPAYRTN